MASYIENQAYQFLGELKITTDALFTDGDRANPLLSPYGFYSFQHEAVKALFKKKRMTYVTLTRIAIAGKSLRQATSSETSIAHVHGYQDERHPGLSLPYSEGPKAMIIEIAASSLIAKMYDILIGRKNREDGQQSGSRDKTEGRS